jgi:hypothetical protein
MSIGELTDFSEECIASIFREKESNKSRPTPGLQMADATPEICQF